MTKLKLLAVTAAIAAGAIVAAQAEDAVFNIKPGLWEMTTTGKATGTLPIPPQALSQMSPEQKAKIEAAMQAAMAKPHVVKSCVTEEQLRRGPTFTGDNKSCKQTIVTRTATQLDIREECTGDEKMSGSFHFQAVNPEAMVGTADITESNGTDSMHMTHNMSGKWLTADCGSVAPRPAH